MLDRKKDGKKVGITAGAFDLCHAGHMQVFKEAKEVCDHLIVALQDDPSTTAASYRGKQKNKPVMSLEERRIILEGIKYIDEIVIYSSEEDLYRLLTDLKPDVRIIGADWQGKQFTGHNLPMQIYFNSRGHNYSTSELRARVHAAEQAQLAAAFQEQEEDLEPAPNAMA
jgi:glycerol-3-phosphate cytidylyltransferase